ncbi:MAG: hypothetical protein WCR08_09110 [Gammaproteobacteria bacterium]
MSHLSELKIALLPSHDYRRLAWILTGWAAAGLYYAHLPWILTFGLSAGMGWGLWCITRSPMPHFGLKTVAFQRGKWILGFQDKMESYDKIQISADSGFFLLIHFSNAQSRASRRLVIFCDQLSKFDLRSLNILEMVGPTTKAIAR